MKPLFFNEDKGLRNGWWALIYLALLAGCLAGFQLLLVPGLKRLGLRSGDWVVGLLFGLSLLAAWICTRLRKESLASTGWRLDGRWAREFAWGTLLGIGVMVLAAGLLWSVGGVTWELDPARSFRALSRGFVVFALVACWEENLFRGFVFQRLLDGVGAWPAQVILALFFGLAHWGNPGMHGATKLWATLDIALAAVFVGLGYLRTRSLALPIGIHLGWNWTQGTVLGFGVSGTTAPHGWVRPVFQGRPEWMSGGAFGLEASVFGVIAVLVGIALLWCWKGRGAAPIGAVPEPWHPESA
ncbi:type II CAAX endopeptidase family protein [Geothrix sp.]|jgi:membrane protease YdiL (CAAX protease family)|uniref:CPBP family intramembrane glutamic endopeptidase n=1 Tax=Geothrix sp. TaxID=1962974 RepID=UPI0025BEFC8B|nr:type II CAAX endopeptidase family protein [Geothrix sp.]